MLAQALGEAAIDAAVLVLVGDGEREDFLLGEIGKAFHGGLAIEVVSIYIRNILNKKSGLLTSGNRLASRVERASGQRGRRDETDEFRPLRAARSSRRSGASCTSIGALRAAMTLGVRAVVIDRQGRIFLVKHSYVSGWHLPGRRGRGRRDDRRGARARAARGGQYRALTAPPRLHGMFFNDRDSRRDHVALFVVRDFRQTAAPVPDHEIIAHGFFAAERAADDTTAGTRARIIEVLGDAPVSERW